MARRFGEAAEEASDRLERARAILGEVAPPRDDRLLPPEKVKRERKKARAEGEAKGKIGRPPKHGDRPWEAEGISRALWYRKRAKATS
jgi:hypothetical protein